mgnify:FL=1|tara:strand:- start:218 stop:667 length:450 start_codon:yes stop_codon:yes gene_type:complete
MISIALYKPDIPQNTASIVRLCACFGIKIHIIEPCGFNLNDSRFKRVVMDYINLSSIIKYESFEELIKKNKRSRILLMSTKAKKSLFKFHFKENDILLLGRESKGVPNYIHKKIRNRLKIPISNKARSLNVALAAAISAAEALKQTNKI